MPSNIGEVASVSRKKQFTDRNPPKALYANLESAHESIALKATASRPTTPSRPSRSPNSFQTSAPHNFAESSVLKTEIQDPKPTTPQSGPLAVQNALRSAGSPTVGQVPDDQLMVQAPAIGHRLSTHTRVEGSRRSMPRKPSIQNVRDSSTGKHGAYCTVQHRRNERIQESTKGHEVLAKAALHTARHPPYKLQDGDNCEASKGCAEANARCRTERLVEDDTVDNILQTYDGPSSDESGERIQRICNTSYEGSSSAGAENGEDFGTRGGGPHQKDPQTKSAVNLEEEARASATEINAMALTAQDSAASHSDGDDPRLFYPGPFEWFKRSSNLPNLDRYAWSPCSSDSGLYQENNPSMAVAHSRAKPKSQPSATHDGESQRSEPKHATASLGLLRCEQQEKPHVLSVKGRYSTASDSLTWEDSMLLAGSNSAGDLHLPEQNILSRRKCVSFHSIGQFSGVVSDGLSSRPMSEAEVAHTLNSMIESTLRRPNSSSAINQTEFDFVRANEHDFARQVTAPVLHQFTGDLATVRGPGSSQSTSSSCFESSAGEMSLRKGWAGIYKDQLSSFASPVRAGTPPGLFGRRAMTFSSDLVELSSSDSRPSDSQLSLMRSNSRLAQAAVAAGIKEDGRLGRALAGSAEQDWVTEIDVMTGADSTRSGLLHSNTDGSLSDSAESRYVSPTDRAQPYHIQSKKRNMLQHVLHPRYNHAWSITKDVQTGSVSLVPDYVSREGNRLPGANVASQARSFTNPGPSLEYQHPVPLSKSHPHPLSSTLQITPSRIDLRGIGQSNKSTYLERMEKDLTSPEFPDMVDEIDKKSTSQGLLNLPDSAPSAHEMADTRLQGEDGLNKASQYASSAWLSTVSESQSSEPSLPGRISSFAKMTVLSRKGNLTGTPEGTGAREVGSSLADASSPGANLSSSPAIITSSPAALSSSPPYHGLPPIADYNTPLSKSADALHNLHRHLEGSAADSSSPAQHHADRPNSSCQRDSFGYLVEQSSDKSTSSHHDSPPHHARAGLLENPFTLPLGAPGFRSPHAKPSLNPAAQFRNLKSSFPPFDPSPPPEDHIDWLKYLPANRRSSRRRCSSSESGGNINLSPLAEKVTGLQSAKKAGHQKRRSAGLFLKKHDINSNDLEFGVRPLDTEERTERQCRPLKSVKSQLLTSNGSVCTNVPTPALDHPLRGPKRSRDRRLRRPAEEKNPFSRPVTRDFSPHLSHLVWKPDAAIDLQHVHYSRMWALVCILVPFLGPLYGHGFLDGIMAWQSDGAIQNFRKAEKTAILVYSYTFFGAVLIALAVAMIFVAR